MFVLFLTFLSYHQNVKVSGPYGVQSALEFGFKKGGEYTMIIKDASTTMIFGLLSQSEKKSNSGFSWDISPNYKICRGEFNIATIQQKVQEGETANLTGTIQSKGVYTPFYYGCSQRYTFELYTEFLNGNNHLDYRYMPLSIIIPVFLALYIILLLVWLGNWFYHFTLQIKIHLFITTCFVLSCVLNGLNVGIILDSQRYGYIRDPIYYSYYVFRILKLLFQLATLILAAKGWYITTKKLKFSEIICPIVFGAIFVIFNELLNMLSLGFIDFLIGLASIVCLALYVYYLTKFVSLGLRDVKAHIYVIKNSGIDPKTTPVYSKYKMFKLYYKALLTYAILLIITIIAELFASSVVWLPSFLDYIANFVLFAFLLYIFWIRQKRNNGYLIFDNGEVEEFSQQDVQSIELDQMEGGNEWDENTPLPPQPIVIPDYPKVEKKSQDHEQRQDQQQEHEQEPDPENPGNAPKSAYGNPIVAPHE